MISLYSPDTFNSRFLQQDELLASGCICFFVNYPRTGTPLLLSNQLVTAREYPHEKMLAIYQCFHFVGNSVRPWFFAGNYFDPDCFESVGDDADDWAIIIRE